MTPEPELHYLSATEAIARFRSRDLSPVELLEAVIERAETVEPTINAFAYRLYDEARAQAREAEARYAGRGGGEPRPLEGVPTAIKDELPVKGQRWTQASLVYRDLIAEETSPLVERILEAGAVVHASTNTPEFSCAGFTHSRLNGITRNPWNPEFAVGGSSGGSGAALAAGSATLASGSDIGGSIRIPASFNGVVGFKPPYGRVPVDPPFNLDVFCHNGPLARTVGDCLLFENVLAGPHPSDTTVIRPKLVLPTALEGIEGMRIALSPDLGCYPLDPEVEENTLAAAEHLRAAGAIVERIDLGLDRALIMRAVSVHFRSIFGAYVGSLLEEHRDELNDYAIEFHAEMERYAEGLSILDGLEAETAVHQVVAAALADHDALVCATVGTRGLIAGDGYVGHGLEVGGVQVPEYYQSILTPLFNIASRHPVLSVPSGVAGNGVPTGIQIVAATFDDLTAFRVGAALERQAPWLDVPARRPRLEAAIA